MAIRMLCRSAIKGIGALRLQPSLASPLGISGPSLLKSATEHLAQTCNPSISSRALHASVAVRGSSRLTDMLNDELKYEEERYAPAEDIERGPPDDWKLTETPRDTHMSLKRAFNGETIVLDVMVNDQPTDGGDLYEDDQGEQSTVAGHPISFNVSVVKGEKSLVFEIASDGSFIEIQHVSLEKTGEEPDEAAFTGPVFQELDEELQGLLHNYIEERGITPDLATYLIALLEDKELREYMSWLGDVKKFVAS